MARIGAAAETPMMNLATLPYGQLTKISEQGSPALLHAVGRAFGLGADERAALAKGSVPGWFYLVLGLGAGIAIGVRVHQAWPEHVPGWLTGKADR